LALNMVVCVKPVPDPAHYNKIQINPEDKTLVRQGVPTVINPLDKHGIEAALQLKEEAGGKVCLVSVAPIDCQEALRGALAMGVDEAYLLSDRAFAGGDSLATARVLAAGIRKLGDVDLIIAGAESSDSGTGHVPSQVGELLGIAHVSNVREFQSMGDGAFLLKKKTDRGILKIRGSYPVVIAVDKQINQPRYANMMGILKAGAKEIRVWGVRDLGLKESSVGIAGSPTQPGNTYEEKHGRFSQSISGEPAQIARQLLDIIKASGFTVAQ